jgi:hypothetical protein
MVPQLKLTPSVTYRMNPDTDSSTPSYSPLIPYLQDAVNEAANVS